MVENNDKKDNRGLGKEGEAVVSFEQGEGRRGFYKTFLTVLVIAAVIAFFTGICLIGVFHDRQWVVLVISLPLLGLLLLIAAIKRIVKIIKMISRPKRTIAELKEQAKPVVDAAREIGSHYRRNYKLASTKHKIIILIIFISFIIIMLLMIAGVILATYSKTHQVLGFVFMGMSGGGMIIFIVSLIIISKRN